MCHTRAEGLDASDVMDRAKSAKGAHIAAHCQLTVLDECVRIYDLRGIITILLV